MTSTATAPGFESSKVHSLTRPNIVSVGTIVWLSSELMFFAGLFAMYFTARAVHPGDWPMTLPSGEKIVPDIAYATPFTIILVASSFTCQWGVFAAEKGDVFKLRRWFALTFIMGLVFVLGQGNEFPPRSTRATRSRRPSTGRCSSSPKASTACTSSAGLVAFILFLARTTLGRFTPAQATAAIVVSYYWHFVDMVWIGLFSVIYIIR